MKAGNTPPERTGFRVAPILGPLGRIAPLLVNGYALVLNVGMTAVLGIVFWFVATRFFSQEQVGVAAALISTMTTISYFAQMNLGSLLVRFLSVSSAGAGRLIGKTYLLSGLVTASAATAFGLGIGSVTEPLAILRDHPAFLGYFVLATVLWSVFALQDAALSGLRRSALVPVENAAYALLKIAVLLGLGVIGLSPTLGIFLAWTLPLIPLILVVNRLIYKALPSGPPEQAQGGPDLRAATGFLGWDFLGSLALGAAFGLAPLIVMSSAGAASTATYHLAWSFAYSIYLIGRAMSVSLVAEGAINPLRLRRLITDTLGHALALVLLAVAVVLAVAPLLMGIFGTAYVDEGATVLRVLALSCIFWTVTTVYCAAARVRRDTRSVAIVQIMTLVVFASVSYALSTRYGATGVALGWLVAHLTICLGIVARSMLTEGLIAPPDWLAALAGSAGRLVKGLRRPAFLARRTAIPLPQGILDMVAEYPFRGRDLIPVKGSLTDVGVAMIVGVESGTPEAVLKFSSTPKGYASLRRHAAALRQMAADDRLRPFADLLPFLLSEQQSDDTLCLVETAVRGTDGRHFLRQGQDAVPALAAAAATLAAMHACTAIPRRIDEDWALRWIDEPIETLFHALGKERDRRLTHLRTTLRNVFIGREARLGLGHGDIWPGNLFFADGPDATPRLAGVVDWDTFRDDALAALDPCQLALTYRMQQTGEEYGPILRSLLTEGTWHEAESSILSAAGLDAELGNAADPALRRGILLLAWLGHVTTVLSQSETAARNRFWLFVNVERVLATAFPAPARTSP
ncbi:phosphotransferase [Tabrizicola sp. M-4]|uniref:lipopolysaccharide biosynthesis protein n=1 Tax=Tabrizicola sp. M-4 TaxID=3055847 RepID=UPI003DAA2611